MDEQDMDLRLLIKQFLSTDAEFRNPSFDPAPYLIQFLKDKSADHEAMIQKQQQLIQYENRARQIVQQICTEHSVDFIKFLETPGIYAQNLQKLKSNVSIVKKKVKQTKALLLNTQKDIQQIHFNCMFNKKVYKELKAIQLRLQQYQTAYLALKNNQYYLCALNLPYIEGQSILQSTLASRSQTLRLRMMSKAIDQLNNFLFFSPKVVLLSSNVLLDRLTEQDQKNNVMTLMISNWDQQETFFKRYKLFKKAFCLDYLSKIWQFNDLQRKQGKLGLIYDIIKGIIRIGKISEITSSIQIYGPKQISNTFLLLKCFKVKQQSQLQSQSPKQKQQNYRWFMDRCTDDKQNKYFISAVMDIIGVLFRKAIIVHKIYYQFQQKQFLLNSSAIFTHVLVQLKKLIDLLYFPQSKNIQQAIQQNSEQQLNQQLRNKLINPLNYINYGYASHIILQSLKLIQKNIIQIQQKQFHNQSIQKTILNKSTQLLASYQQQFYTNFHRDYLQTMQEIYCKEIQCFVIQSFQIIISYKIFKNDQVKYMKGYKSDDRKAIKQYVYLLSFMKSLEEFFRENNLSMVRVSKYLLMSLLFFYLKLNYHILTTLLQAGQIMVIQQQRKMDKKLRKKQQQIRRTYSKIFIQKQLKQQKFDKFTPKQQQKNIKNNNIGISYHTIDKLKIIFRQNQMLLGFSCQFFNIQQQKDNQIVIQFIKLITRLQPANYDEQIKSKLLRVWQTLPDSDKSIKQYISAVLYKIIQLQCIVMAKIYRQTGNF